MPSVPAKPTATPLQLVLLPVLTTAVVNPYPFPMFDAGMSRAAYPNAEVDRFGELRAPPPDVDLAKGWVFRLPFTKLRHGRAFSLPSCLSQHWVEGRARLPATTKLERRLAKEAGKDPDTVATNIKVGGHDPDRVRTLAAKYNDAVYSAGLGAGPANFRVLVERAGGRDAARVEDNHYIVRLHDPHDLNDKFCTIPEPGDYSVSVFGLGLYDDFARKLHATPPTFVLSKGEHRSVFAWACRDFGRDGWAVETAPYGDGVGYWVSRSPSRKPEWQRS